MIKNNNEINNWHDGGAIVREAQRVFHEETEFSMWFVFSKTFQEEMPDVLVFEDDGYSMLRHIKEICGKEV